MYLPKRDHSVQTFRKNASNAALICPEDSTLFVSSTDVGTRMDDGQPSPSTKEVKIFLIRSYRLESNLSNDTGWEKAMFTV